LDQAPEIRKLVDQMSEHVGPDVDSDGGMKVCPFCAEPIRSAAIKCKHCNEMLTADDTERAKLIRRQPSRTPSSKAAAALAAFAGLWFLFVGISSYYGGQSTQNLYRGTVLEHDSDVNRMMSNAMTEGSTQMVVGVALLFLGGLITAAGTRPQVPAATSVDHRAGGRSAGRSSVEKVAIGVGIFFALLLGIPLILLILGVIGNPQ
jgi:hypothetical protein